VAQVVCRPPWNSRGLPYQGAKWSFYAQRQGGKYRPLVSCASECRKCAIKSHPITPKYTSKREALRKENVWPQTMRIPCFNKRYRINSFTILFPAKNAPRRPAPGGPDCDCGRACLDTAKHCALYLLLRCLPSGSFCATQRLDCASKVCGAMVIRRRQSSVTNHPV